MFVLDSVHKLHHTTLSTLARFVLDSVHKLHHTTFSTLARFISYRLHVKCKLTLPSITYILSPMPGFVSALSTLNKVHDTCSLCQDRVLVLPDGTRLISHTAHQDMCSTLNLTSEQLKERGVLPIHPSFRIVASKYCP